MEILETLLPGVSKAIFNNIRNGNCVLILGPKIAVPIEHSDGMPCRIEDYFASKLALPSSSTAAACDLRTAIARHEQHSGGDAILRSLVQEAAGNLDTATTELHRDLAALPFRLVVQTTPDRMMLNAFRESGKTATTEACFNFKDDDTPNAVRAEPSMAMPLVYNLFGCHEQPESMVLTDGDLLDYLVNLTRGTPRLPDGIRSLLRDNKAAFLFIGFGFANWWLRLLLKVLEITTGRQRVLSVALEDNASYAQAVGQLGDGLFEKFIHVREGDWNGLAREMANRYRNEAARPGAVEKPAPVPASGAPRPMVFISYASDDRPLVDRLRVYLDTHGIDVWQDKQNLRAGDYWDPAIRKAIRDADYFLFMQTENMDRERDGVYNRELKAAIEVLEDRPGGVPYLIRATSGVCQPRLEPELEDVHWAELDSRDGVPKLANDILSLFQAQLARRQPQRAGASQ